MTAQVQKHVYEFRKGDGNMGESHVAYYLIGEDDNLVEVLAEAVADDLTTEQLFHAVEDGDDTHATFVILEDDEGNPALNGGAWFSASLTRVEGGPEDYEITTPPFLEARKPWVYSVVTYEVDKGVKGDVEVFSRYYPTFAKAQEACEAFRLNRIPNFAPPSEIDELKANPIKWGKNYKTDLLWRGIDGDERSSFYAVFLIACLTEA